MTLWQAIVGYTTVAAVMTIIPGLDTVFVLRQALRDRRAVAFASGLGICAGTLVWGTAAAAGVAALFVASQTAFTVLRFAGVGYLLWLAWGYLRSAWQGTGGVVLDESRPERMDVGDAFVRGLLTNLLNPKIAVFYLTVLPLFLPAGYPKIAVGAGLAGIHALLGIAWFAVIIAGAQAVRRFLVTRRGTRVVDATAGVAMAGFAVALGVEHR